MTRTMRICFLGARRYARPLDAASAAKFRLLDSIGEVWVVAFATTLRPASFTDHAHFRLLPRLPTSPARYAMMVCGGTALALDCVVRHRVDVLVAQSPYEGLSAALAKLLARMLGKRVSLVVESHSDFEHSLFAQRRMAWPGIHRLLMRAVARLSLRSADALRAVSHSTAQQLRKFEPTKPLAQFPTWTDIEVFVSAAGAPKVDEVAFAGVLTPLKGVLYLVEAFGHIASAFPDARLALIGEPLDPEYAARLQARVRELKLAERADFVGHLDQPRLAARLAAARVLVLPSLSEGLPRVIFEAMAAGTPVIGTHVGGMPEIIQEGVNGFLVPPRDETALVAALRDVLAAPERARDMGQRARAFAVQFFSADSYVESYRRLLTTARGGAAAAPEPRDEAPVL